MENLYKKVSEIIVKGQVKENEFLSGYSSFRIGGMAALLTEPGNAEELTQLTEFLTKQKVPFCIIGNGTNILFSDKGFDGVIVKIGKNMSSIRIEEDTLYAEAGTLLSTAAAFACENSLAGMEFASGIPGSVGGAVVMNAGAYDREMKDITEKVFCIDFTGNSYEINKEEMNFGYRKSIIQDNGFIVTAVEFKLKKDRCDDIKKKAGEFAEMRKRKQPLNIPSCGSTFKRPEGHFAAKLIDEAGLKGLKHGDAMVSDKHCGFIVNCGNATSEQVKTLMKIVQETVYAKFQILLEPEIIIIE